MSKSSLLIIFYRNPELGKVKTRLAKAVGNEKALAIYIKLSSYTRQITEDVSVNKVVYYSQFVDTEDHWPNEIYKKKVQKGNNLGEKMHNAFAQAFKEDHQSACIIGTDCLELTPSIIRGAFNKLITHDVVIGPAVDGGYYLLGMNKLYSEIFKNKSWGTATVGRDTVMDFKNLKLRFSELQTLSDIDDEKDLLQSGKLP